MGLRIISLIGGIPFLPGSLEQSSTVDEKSNVVMKPFEKYYNRKSKLSILPQTNKRNDVVTT